VTFPNAYVTAGDMGQRKAIGGHPAQNLILAGHTLTVNIHAAVVTMPITVDSSSQLHVRGGSIAGVVDTQELLGFHRPHP